MHTVKMSSCWRVNRCLMSLGAYASPYDNPMESEIDDDRSRSDLPLSLGSLSKIYENEGDNIGFIIITKQTSRVLDHETSHP